MKNLLLKVWEWLKTLFQKDDTKSTLLKILLDAYNSEDLDVIKDKDFGDKAILFVQELNNRDDLTGTEKAAIFNEKMLEYAKKIGKVIATCALNLLRELAVLAVKAAITSAASSLLVAQAVQRAKALENTAPTEDK